MLLHYLAKIKNQIFCRYLADMEKYKQTAFLSPRTAVFVNNQHCFQQRGQDSDKKFVVETACPLDSLTVWTVPSMRVFLPLPGRLSTVPGSRNIFNSLLTPRLSSFLGKFVCQPLCCAPLQIQTFLSKSCLHR